jgi:hypothetical protein
MKAYQSNIFDLSNRDLPIFSGTPPRAGESVFSPTPAERQFALGIPDSSPQPQYCAQCSALAEAIHAALDSVGDFVGNWDYQDPHHDLGDAMRTLEDALSAYYNDLASQLHTQ